MITSPIIAEMHPQRDFSSCYLYLGKPSAEVSNQPQLLSSTSLHGAEKCYDTYNLLWKNKLLHHLSEIWYRFCTIPQNPASVYKD